MFKTLKEDNFSGEYKLMFRVTNNKALKTTLKMKALIKKFNWSKYFLLKHEAKLFAFVAQRFGELRRAAIEHGDFSLLLILDLLEDFVPVGSAGGRSSLQAGD